ncbi:hypothetical protein HN51_067990 [Arachis hypogaea]
MVHWSFSYSLSIIVDLCLGSIDPESQVLLNFKKSLHSIESMSVTFETVEPFNLDLSGVSFGSSPTKFFGMIPSSIGNPTNLHVLQISNIYGAYSDHLSRVAQLSSLQYVCF